MTPLEGMITLCYFLAASMLVVGFVKLIGWIVDKIDPEEDFENEDHYGEEGW